MSTGCKHQGQCSGHQFCSEAFQVGAGVWKGSACCIRQLQPCKGQGCFGKETFAETFPSPRSLLSASRSHTHAHTLTHSHSAPAYRNGEATQSDAALHRKHMHVPKPRTPQQLPSTPKAWCTEQIITLGLVDPLVPSAGQHHWESLLPQQCTKGLPGVGANSNPADQTHHRPHKRMVTKSCPEETPLS